MSGAGAKAPVKLLVPKAFEPTAPLNDTGITACSNSNINNQICPQGGFPGQDAEWGRDVTHNDNSDGHAGFSFTRICNNGDQAGQGACPVNPPLGSGPNDWGCTLDNVTNLMWEVKTDDSGLRDKDWTYTWHNPDGSTNGGNPGTQNGGSCNGSACDTAGYVAAINVAGLCGHHDWYLPKREELRSLAAYDRIRSASDAAYFPRSIGSFYWSASPYARYAGHAWFLSFYDGGSHATSGNYDYYVRLVRAGQ